MNTHKIFSLLFITTSLLLEQNASAGGCRGGSCGGVQFQQPVQSQANVNSDVLNSFLQNIGGGGRVIGSVGGIGFANPGIPGSISNIGFVNNGISIAGLASSMDAHRLSTGQLISQQGGFFENLGQVHIIQDANTQVFAANGQPIQAFPGQAVVLVQDQQGNSFFMPASQNTVNTMLTAYSRNAVGRDANGNLIFRDDPTGLMSLMVNSYGALSRVATSNGVSGIIAGDGRVQTPGAGIPGAQPPQANTPPPTTQPPASHGTPQVGSTGQTRPDAPAEPTKFSKWRGRFNQGILSVPGEVPTVDGVNKLVKWLVKDGKDLQLTDSFSQGLKSVQEIFGFSSMSPIRYKALEQSCAKDNSDDIFPVCTYAFSVEGIKPPSKKGGKIEPTIASYLHVAEKQAGKDCDSGAGDAWTKVVQKEKDAVLENGRAKIESSLGVNALTTIASEKSSTKTHFRFEANSEGNPDLVTKAKSDLLGEAFCVTQAGTQVTPPSETRPKSANGDVIILGEGTTAESLNALRKGDRFKIQGTEQVLTVRENPNPGTVDTEGNFKILVATVEDGKIHEFTLKQQTPSTPPQQSGTPQPNRLDKAVAAIQSANGCLSCHNPKKKSAGVDLSTAENIQAYRDRIKENLERMIGDEVIGTKKVDAGEAAKIKAAIREWLDQSN